MYVVTLCINVPPKRHKDFMEAIHSFLEPCRVQPGCNHCSFYQEFDNSDSVILLQEWDSRDALEKHLKSREFRIILSIIDLSDLAPVYKLHTVSKIEGLEAVETLRLEA